MIEATYDQLHTEKRQLEEENGELKEALFYAKCEAKQSDETERRLMKERDDLQEAIQEFLKAVKEMRTLGGGSSIRNYKNALNNLEQISKVTHEKIPKIG